MTMVVRKGLICHAFGFLEVQGYFGVVEMGAFLLLVNGQTPGLPWLSFAE